MTENYTWKETTGNLSIRDPKPNYNITFHRDNKQVGVLDFNGPEMAFSGDMDESAKVFFDCVANAFKGRLEQERADERKKCLEIADDCADSDMHASMVANFIRARGNT